MEETTSTSPPPAPENPALPYVPGTSTAKLSDAVSEGNLQTVRRILNAGAPVEDKDAAGFTPLHLAVQYGHEQIAHLLLSHGADTSATTPSGDCPLVFAIAANDTKMARILLDHGASIESLIGPYRASLLGLAVAVGSGDLVKLLLERGADPKAKCQCGHGDTLLHTAVAAGHDELLPLLIATGVDVNLGSVSPAGRTPLHVAASHGYEVAARTLLDAGSDVSARCQDGRTPLHLAAEHGQADMIRLLLERGADAMALTSYGETALCVAASHEKTTAVGVLLYEIRDVLTEGQKAVVMISAARSGSLGVMRQLVRKEFSVNACGDDSQFSALEAAAVHHHEAVVIFLLENGARPNLSAIRAARQINHDRIRGLLNGTLPLPTQQRMPDQTSLRNVLIDRESVEASLAIFATESGRRRITPAADPGGIPPNCHTCRDLDFRKGRAKDVEVMLLATSEDLTRAAEQGCPGCIMIRQCQAHLADFARNGLAGEGAIGKNSTLLSLVRGGPLYIITEAVTGKPQTARAEIYSHPGMFHVFTPFL